MYGIRVIVGGYYNIVSPLCEGIFDDYPLLFGVCLQPTRSEPTENEGHGT